GPDFRMDCRLPAANASRSGSDLSTQPYPGPDRFLCTLPNSYRRAPDVFGRGAGAAASLADCQNFSAAGLSRPLVATMPTENGFGSGVRCKNFIRFPKLYPKSTVTATPVPASTADMTPGMLSCSS